MSRTFNSSIAVVGIDIGKNTFHVVGLEERGVIVLRQKWSRSQVQARFANLPPCLIGMEACVGTHHLSRRLKTLALLWQIYSRRFSLQIHFRQCGHRCDGSRAKSSRMAWRTAGKVG